MKTAKQLREERKQKQDALNAIRSAVKAANAETAEQRQDADKLLDEIEALNGEIQRAERLEENERQAAAREAEEQRRNRDRQHNDGLDPEAREIAKNFSIGNMVRAAALGGPEKLEGFDKEMHDEGRAEFNKAGAGANQRGVAVPMKALAASMGIRHEQRNMTVTGGSPVGSEGGFVVPTTTGGLIEILRPMTLTAQYATRLDGLVGNLELPREKSKATATFKAETGAADKSTPELDKIILTPHRLPAQIEVSNQLLMQSGSVIDTLVRRQLLGALAEKLDATSIQGGGSNEPKGILAWLAGTGQIRSIGTNGGALTRKLVIALEELIESANGLGGTLAYMTNPKVKAFLKDLAVDSGSGKFVWGDDNVVNGYPAFSTPQVPGNISKGTGTNLSALIFGDWGNLIQASWGGINLILDPYTKASTGEQVVTAEAFYDVDLFHLGKFSAITDANTAA